MARREGRGGCELVSNLLNLEQTTLGSNVGHGEVANTVDDGGSRRTRNTVVVRFPDAAEGSDIGLHEVVLGQVWHGQHLFISIPWIAVKETHQKHPSR